MSSSFTEPLTNQTFEALQKSLPEGVSVLRDHPLASMTTFHTGGAAKWFVDAADSDTLAAASLSAQRLLIPYVVIGSGSNILISDDGIPSLVIRNRSAACHMGELTVADTGVSLSRLFALSRRAALSGLEFAVGIPGTLGGALVSNAGAYRQNISDVVKRVQVVTQGTCAWYDADWMQFSYRHSILRDSQAHDAVLIKAEITLKHDDPYAIAARSLEFQQQRKGKQPLERSAGSFFKNVINPELAARFPGLSDALRQSGVIPAGAIVEAAGLKGIKLGDAQISPKHANFIVNNAHATSSQIRSLANYVKRCVYDRFGVMLEEEVLQIGDWSHYKPIPWEDISNL
ncbi:MAG: UDP-N-acetylmuramate dehydrogenase [Armatimonadota bacterium]